MCRFIYLLLCRFNCDVSMAKQIKILLYCSLILLSSKHPHCSVSKTTIKFIGYAFIYLFNTKLSLTQKQNEPKQQQNTKISGPLTKTHTKIGQNPRMQYFQNKRKNRDSVSSKSTKACYKHPCKQWKHINSFPPSIQRYRKLIQFGWICLIHDYASNWHLHCFTLLTFCGNRFKQYTHIQTFTQLKYL